MSSKRTFSRRSLLKGAAAGGGALLLSKTGLASGPTGFITTAPPYAVPSRAGVHIKPILTVGEGVGGYRMVGIPDGLGALDCGRTFEVFMNHELGNSVGVTRGHGSKGAFVSKWTISSNSLHVLKGEDLTQSPTDVHVWGGSAYSVGTTVWNRLCSADLPAASALRHGRLGTGERIFLDGEESGIGGRAWARIVTGPNTGEAWELPRLGKMSYENVVACPHGKSKTIVALFDDGNVDPTVTAANNPSEVFIYIGTKQSNGSEIERAGLTSGKFYGVRVQRGATLVNGENNEFGLGDSTSGFVGKARFDLVELGTAGDVSAMTGLQIEENAVANNVFRFQRPEDGAWDPRESCTDSLYFVTTGSIVSFPGHSGAALPADYANAALFGVNKASRLWKLKFDDIDNPLCGGRIEILLDGQSLKAPGWRMFDNICIDRHGRLLLQEDTGNHPWVARIWVYGLDNGTLTEVAHHNEKLFDPSFGGVPGGNITSPDFITQDEESSGIIDAEHILGKGWFLFVVQNHKGSADVELVEGGQLLALYVDPRIGVPRHHPRHGHHPWGRFSSKHPEPKHHH